MKSLKGKKLSLKTSFYLALKEAQKGKGFVSPNPPVGAVFLDKHYRFLSSGYHKAYGRAHAEQEALKKIKDKALLKGGHLYVTLEPCSHFGKTPPCVEALEKLHLSSVTYGMKDPNPLVSGKGIQFLKKRGIKTKIASDFKEEVKNLYQVYSFNHKYQKPFVSLKVATSLDGIMSLNQGSGKWISSEKSREYASWMRAYNDAVLIGVGTFLEDNPRLNSRVPLFKTKKNKVIILDPAGRSLKHIAKSNLAKCRPLSHITICVSPDVEIKKSDFKIVKIKMKQNEFHLSSLLDFLYKEGVSSLLVEGGSGVFTSFLNQGECQKFYQFINPSIIGGKNGRNPFEGFTVKNLEDNDHFDSKEFFKLGNNLLFKGLFKNKS